VAKKPPELLTPRLRLRPFRANDARAVAALCAEREIAATTLLIPHPYGLGDAKAWIAGHAPAFAEGKRVDFAVALRAEGTLVGAAGLRLEPDHNRAELGYWIGKAHWNMGFATEAARAVLGFGFRICRLHRIYAHHMASNPASGEVLLKLGMRYEGRVRQHVLKWDRYEDILIFGILRPEWNGGPESD
jgi:RimJ/RimL family protein N-acetyltransferase